MYVACATYKDRKCFDLLQLIMGYCCVNFRKIVFDIIIRPIINNQQARIFYSDSGLLDLFECYSVLFTDPQKGFNPYLCAMHASCKLFAAFKRIVFRRV